MSLKLLQSTLLISFSFIWGLLCVNGERILRMLRPRSYWILMKLCQKALAYVIPIREQIGPPILDITRRVEKRYIQKCRYCNSRYGYSGW